MAIKVKFRREPELKTVVFSFSSNKWEMKAIVAMAAFIKDSVPSSAREYDGNTHEWTVLDPFWPPLENMFNTANWVLEETAPTVTPEDFFYENQGTASSEVVSREELGNRLLALLGITAEQLADHNAAKKAYRRQALAWHPDRNGGDGSRMSELNSIWSAYNAN